MSNRLSRRTFMHTGVAAAIGASLTASTAFAADRTASYSHANAVAWDAEYDVVVAGYGGAGAVAAITAAEAGAKVLLVDKAPDGEQGGNTRYCEQYFCIPRSYEDGVAFYTAMAEGFDTATEEVIDYMAKGSVEIGDWLLDHGATTFSSAVEGLVNGLTLDGVATVEGRDWFYEKSDGTVGFSEYPVWPDGTPNEGRICEFTVVDHPDDNQKKYWNLLVRNVEMLGNSIDVWLASPARHLIQDPFTKTVLGVQIEHEGAMLNVRAKNGVVLACGSYEANPAMFETFAQLPDAHPIGTLHNTGDGITMGLEVGADLWHMSALSGPWLVARLGDSERCFSTSYSYQRITRAGNCINVGSDAKRFMNDSGRCKHGHVSYGGTSMNQIAPNVIWAIMDATARNGEGDIALISDEHLFMADTIEELAEKIDLDPATLAQTVTDWNQIVTDGVDPKFDRDPYTMAPIETAPFYAVRLYAGCVNSQGGPRRNIRCEVLDTQGNPIPNLYSAGELGSFWAGVYIAGGNIAETVYTGRTAGANAAISKEPPTAVELVIA